MAKKALIKLKSKPKHPKRKTLTLRQELFDGYNLAQALESLGNSDPADCFIREDYCDYDGNRRVYLCCNREQTDKELNKDLGRYNKQLKEYKKWYKENEATILAEIERRKQIALDRREKADKRERLRLEKELKRIRKLLQK